VSSGWWAARVRRFGRYFTGRVSAAERAELTRWLTPPQLALFESMHRADQRHGLDVVRSLRAHHQIDRDLLIAGLLHDCGKGRDLHVWHRVGWSLSERYGNRVDGLMRRVPSFPSAFSTIEDHAERSAELALRAGVSAAAADLIRHQAEPLDDERGRALLLADQSN
jgi:hypothetical protein